MSRRLITLSTISSQTLLLPLGSIVSIVTQARLIRLSTIHLPVRSAIVHLGSAKRLLEFVLDVHDFLLQFLVGLFQVLVLREPVCCRFCSIHLMRVLCQFEVLTQLSLVPFPAVALLSVSSKVVDFSAHRVQSFSLSFKNVFKFANCVIVAGLLHASEVGLDLVQFLLEFGI